MIRTAEISPCGRYRYTLGRRWGDGPKLVIDAMVEDVLREASGEIVDSKEARAAIGRRAAQLFRARLAASLTQP